MINTFVRQPGDKSMNQSVAFIDQDFCNVFDFPFVKGDAETAFQNPFSIVITEKVENESTKE